jgi:hypothetical protein
MRDHPDGPSGDLSLIRIATAGYQHESNTFSSIPASLDLWRRSGILEDAASIRAEYASSQSTLAGFFAEAGQSTEDASNVKRFVSAVEGGGDVRVYEQQVSAKLVDITVEHNSNIVITSTLGIVKLTIS